MPKTPLISVIMPVYNNERYLPNAVDSVIYQPYDDWELIIINDGSTDKTPEIADSYAKKDKRITVIHQDNQWMYASINNGIKKANGEYIYLLNSDDTFVENAFLVMADIAEKYDPDVIWTKVLIHDCDDKQSIINTHYIDYGDIADNYYGSLDSVRKNYYLFAKYLYSQNQANLYRTAIARKHQHKNIYYGEDKIFNIDVASDIKSAYVCSPPIYNHFYYDAEVMNISVGKWYDYEHRMFNEFYNRYVSLFKSWNFFNDNSQMVLSRFRLDEFKHELNMLLSKKCPLSVTQKLAKLFEEIIDDVTIKCAQYLGAIREVEYRILSTTKELLRNEIIDTESEYYFVLTMLDTLMHYMLRYERKTSDLDKFREGVNHPRNPYHIGKTIYDELIIETKK